MLCSIPPSPSRCSARHRPSFRARDTLSARLLGTALCTALALAGCQSTTPTSAPPQESEAATPVRPLPAPLVEAAQGHPGLVLVSWDGAGDEIIDRLLAEGRLPHLAALAARGLAADWSVTSFPSKTATAHATLWTGCWPAHHGVTANSTPLDDLASPFDPDRNPLRSRRSGFDSRALTAEPLYVTAARAGRSVAVLSATQSYPHGVHLKSLKAAGLPEESFAARYRSTAGFEHELAPARRIGPVDLAAASPPADGGAAWGFGTAGSGELGADAREMELMVGDTPVFLLLFGEGEGGEGAGLDRVLVRVGSRSPDAATAEALLRPEPPGMLPQTGNVADGLGAWSPPLAVSGLTGDDDPSSRTTGAALRTGNVFFRLFALSGDGSDLLLYQRAAHGLDGAVSGDDLAAYQEAYAGFHDNGFDVYMEGAAAADGTDGADLADGEQGLGLPLPLGGDGSAEERLLEIVDLEYRLLADGTRWALDSWSPDVLFHYAPTLDTAGHLWMGLLHPESAGYDREIADRLWPVYARIAGLADRWLGEIVSAAGDDTIVALTSDHGMSGIVRSFQVDHLLAEAGLLAWTDDGRPDLAASRILAPAFGDAFFLVVNDERFGGPVTAFDRETVLAEASAALLAARDPDNPAGPDAPVVERVFRPDHSAGLGIGGPRGGDLYYDLAPGYYPRRFGRDRGPGATTSGEASPWGSTGQHGFWPERRDMHAIFYAAGPGIAPGTRVAPIRHVDVAPTLARLIGIPAPDCGGRGSDGLAVGLE